jgi:hypothetical protein
VSLLSLRCVRSGNIQAAIPCNTKPCSHSRVLMEYCTVLYRAVLWQPCIHRYRTSTASASGSIDHHCPPSPIHSAELWVEALSDGTATTPTTARLLIPSSPSSPRPTRWWREWANDSKDSRIARQSQRPTLPAPPPSPWPSLALPTRLYQFLPLVAF